jgi:hypothetical protein
MILMPTLTLVVLVLGALSVDLAVVHLGQRQAFAAASAAANDAATYGLDPTALQQGEGAVLDAARARRAAAASLAGEDALDPSAQAVVAIDGTTVTVTVVLDVSYVFAQGIPGSGDGTTVRATASADATER